MGFRKSCESTGKYNVTPTTPIIISDKKRAKAAEQSRENLQKMGVKITD
jgi:hypothetical protein